MEKTANKIKASVLLAIVEAAKQPWAFGNISVLKAFVHEFHPGVNIVLDGPAVFDHDLEKFKRTVIEILGSTVVGSPMPEPPAYQIGFEKNKMFIYLSFAGDEIDGEIERGKGLTEEISPLPPLTMKNAQNLLYAFWQRTSDACPLEASAADKEVKEFEEWVKENYAY